MSEKVSAEDRRRAYSYGAGFKARFYYAGAADGWVVFNARTGKIYAKNLEEWEAPGRCMYENERLGTPAIPDLAAIDSTP
jgi:hypothetical protein